jgi:hypothetical protein
MISVQSLLMRSLAAFMPIYLIGLCVACVMLCSSHKDERRDTNLIYSSVALGSSHEEECCPMTSVPATVPPDRPLLTPSASNSQPIALVSISINAISTGLISNIRNACLLSSFDPPFERLCTLRV